VRVKGFSSESPGFPGLSYFCTMIFQTTFNSPLGLLLLKSDGQYLNSIVFSDKIPLNETDCLVLQECRQQLNGYFAGKIQSFNLPLKPEGTAFQQKVWKELQQIPYGKTITYKQLAIRMGDVNTIRAVGSSNGKNPILIVIPCHRVIGTGNKLIGYAGGLERKLWLLQHEMKNTDFQNNVLFPEAL
jgi:methylated-DNA-[protein]-cysteine S-methyltransferase